jgi:hypothetical protein
MPAVAIVWNGEEPTLKSSLRVALSVEMVLNLLILFLAYVGWKRIGCCFRCSTT